LSLVPVSDAGNNDSIGITALSPVETLRWTGARVKHRHL